MTGVRLTSRKIEDRGANCIPDLNNVYIGVIGRKRPQEVETGVQVNGSFDVFEGVEGGGVDCATDLMNAG